MLETMTALIDAYGYAAIAFLIWVENVFPPIPSEVVLLFGGFMTTYSTLNPWGAVAAATLGSAAGAAVLYYVGRMLGKEKLRRLLDGKCGKMLHLCAQDVDQAGAWFEKYDTKAVLFCRCVPIVRSLISIPAGLAEMKPLPFFFFTIVGSAVWNTVLVWMGRFAGTAWEESLQYFGWYTRLTVIVLGIAAVAAAVLLLYQRKKQ